jgi:serine phosphatase RsbU (regulator of sigma subunit)
LRYAAHLGAGAAALALWVILALGVAPILWLLNLSTLVVGAGFITLPWLSPWIPTFAPDSVRTRLAGGLFNGALIPLLIAVTLVLDAPGMAATASVATREMAFGVAIALSIAVGAAGWWFALVLVTPLARLVRGVERIAAGVRPTVFDARGPQEVEELAAAVLTMSGKLDEEMRALAEARDKHKEVAEKLQRALQVPLSAFPDLDVASVYHSASEVAGLGGDFYDVFRTADGRVGLLIGDVSGRGLDAAAEAVLTRASLRAFIYGTDSPAEALSRANRFLVDAGTRGFVTVYLGVLDLASGLLVYASAGHPPPVRVAAGRSALLGDGGTVMGVFDDAGFRDTSLQLGPGDLLLLYTDGLTEAKKDGDYFGEERLLAMAATLYGVGAAVATRAVYEAVVEYAGGVLLDDLAVLAVRF